MVICRTTYISLFMLINSSLDKFNEFVYHQHNIYGENYPGFKRLMELDD